jgi:hypothetical protein
MITNQLEFMMFGGPAAPGAKCLGVEASTGPLAQSTQDDIVVTGMRLKEPKGLVSSLPPKGG